MRRPLLPAALAALVLVTGCGTERVVPAGPSGSPDPDYAARRKAGLTEHDRRFPGVADRCADVRPGPSAAAPTGPLPAGEPYDPERAKYAENHAFQQQLPMKADAECRGRAHADRIAGALAGVRDEGGLRAALSKLGYPADGTEVYGSGPALAFSLMVPGAGPCVTGFTGPPVRVEAHGPYMEGGCVKPRGGH
ncbi:hypothetical protein ACF068_24060 [Streptomyces sp. NPDC016309]|uniref:hypothetical protein n=1 Tax=Streptomyces sp. NPDC016309 TaxID=3364965 RepID=UPI0036FFE722